MYEKKEGQPAPNLLFGAVHILLLKGVKHPLKDYYHSLTKYPKPYREAFEPFKDFCHTYQKAIEEILATKIVQTNEVRRYAYLYPVFCSIYEKTKEPLSIIEIGTSARLKLFWDQYSYSYGEATVYGNHNSKLHMTAKIFGKHPQVLLKNSPPVANRIGVDLHTVDINNEGERLWLQAFIDLAGT